MEVTNYLNIQENKPFVIGNRELNLNQNNFYCIVRDNYNRMIQAENSELIETLPTQSNIRMIQQIYLDLIKTKEIVVIEGVSINFSSDKWDFTSKYKAGKTLTLYTINFPTSDEIGDYKNILLKLFAIYMITEYGLHCGSNKNRLSVLSRLMKFMQDKKIELIEHLGIENYKEFSEQENINYTTSIKNRRYIRDFLTFYSIIANDVYTKELAQWFDDVDTDKINAIQLQNKMPLLPTSFYEKYASKLYEILMDTSADKWDRGKSGLLYIGTQTGLRLSELTILRTQDLEVKTFKNKEIGILHYRSTKSGNGKNNVYDAAETNANKKVIAAYRLLDSLFEEERKELKNDFLVPRNMNASGSGRIKTKREEISIQALNRFNKLLCVTNCVQWELLNTKDKDSFGGCWIYDPNDRDSIPDYLAESVGLKAGDAISYPVTRQYRVYVASELRERGIDDRTTAYLLNHHCVEMYGYYVRPKHSIQEDIDFSREIVADVVRDGTKILGPKGDALTDKINKIIAENNFNVETDLDAIIDKVCNEVPIRAKSGGFCMKSNPRRECRHDSKTDEFMCAYGCCPNHCHMYFMLPISYEKVKTLYKTYNYNLQAGFKNAAEKEGYKLSFAITNELIPELNETRNELNKRSVEDIIKAHPEMNDVIYKLDEIEKEVNEWNQQIEMN